MKRLTKVTATVAALALATTPAFADNNGKGPQKRAAKQVSVELNGTVKTVTDASTVTVLVKTSSQPKALKELTKTLKDATITLKSDTKTVVKRNGATLALGSLTVGDKVNVRAACGVVASKVVCTASRVTAVSGTKPSPSPSPAATKNFDLELRGTVVSNSASVNGRVLGVTASAADVGHDATFKAKSILGTTVTIYTDSATAVTKAGLSVNADTLTGNPVVSIEASCTTASPAVCTAKRITVIVPTA